MSEMNHDELRELCDRLLEGQLTPEQQQRLEELVLTQPDARRFYVEYTHQHGCLHWNAGEPGFVMPALPQPTPAVAKSPARTPRWLRIAAMVAAAVALVVGTWLFARPARPLGPAVATLVGSKSCRWDSGTLPTEEGARLPQGRLRLAEGIARITFDSGAEITLEAPADLELTSRNRCVLHTGRLVAKVPPPAIGFIVDTPTAVMTDLGTEFGVNVKDAQTAELQVFNGIVDAKHRASGKTDRLPTGRNRRYGATEVADFDPHAEKPTAGGAARADGAKVVHISTALGRGKDAYIQPLFPSAHHSDTLLLIKNTVNDKSDYNRKIYLGLDLSSVAGQTILDAQLSLAFTPTGMGFASEVPDATFAVYGLRDGLDDDWDESTIRWRNAPANKPGGVDLDADKVVKLGTFQIAQGALQGTRGIAGPELVKFLAADTNGLATFIIVRETVGSGRSDLVHGFASKNHPYLAPPTLKLTLAPR